MLLACVPVLDWTAWNRFVSRDQQHAYTVRQVFVHSEPGMLFETYRRAPMPASKLHTHTKPVNSDTRGDPSGQGTRMCAYLQRRQQDRTRHTLSLHCRT